MNSLQVEKYVRSLQGFIQHDDNFALITLAFKKGFSEWFLRRSVGKYMTYLNREVVSRDYHNKGVSLNGFVIQERHSDGYPHFHILIRKPTYKDCSFFKLADKSKRCAVKLTYHRSSRDKLDWTDEARLAPKTPHNLIRSRGIDVQMCYNNQSNTLPEYLTKQFKRWKYCSGEEVPSFAVLGTEKLCFMKTFSH